MREEVRKVLVLFLVLEVISIFYRVKGVCMV